MPQPQAPKQVGPRGNSAMAQPPPWQVEDRCGICDIDFSLMTTRHHCRYCGLSVCGKHSRNKLLVPTSPSKSPQRVCDKCYPTCLRMAKGLVPPPRRDVPNDKQRLYTGETKNIQDKSHRMRGFNDDVIEKLEDSGRKSRKWNEGNDVKEPRRMERRNIEPQTTSPARDRRIKSPRAKSPQSARLPRNRDLPQMMSSRENGSRERSARKGDLHPRDLLRDPRDKEQRSKESREKDPRRKDILGRDPREKERRMQDPRDRERRNRDPRDRDPRARDAQDRDPRDRERRDRERRGRALHERDLFDDAPRVKSSRDLPKQSSRRRMPSTERGRDRKLDRSPVSKRVAGKVRGETSSSCRTASSTLTAALLSNEERNPRRHKEEQDESNTFADSAYSIFSLAGSDPEDSEDKTRNDAEVKKKKAQQPKSKVIKRESKEKKEHLDFSASSSSVMSMDMSLITQKYLAPKPAAVPKSSLQLTIEEGSDEESTIKGLSRRNGAPLAKNHDKRRGDTPKMLPPFRQNRAGSTSFRDSGKILRGQDGRDGKTNFSRNNLSMSTSEYDEFEQTRPILDSDKSISGSNKEDENDTQPLAASDREYENSAAMLRAKRIALAGIDAASLEAIEKGFKAADYKLTPRDQKMMRQISELETSVLQHQKELVDLLDMYSEAVKRSRKAQMGLQRAKVRIARYEKAHAAVARAIRTGKLYIKQKEYMAAILELSRAADIEPLNATLWYLLAECRLLVGQPAAAEKACMTCLKLQPTGVGVAMLGRILHERGRHDEAIECYLSALGQNDESEDE